MRIPILWDKDAITSSFYRQRNQGMKELSKLPEVTQLSKWQNCFWPHSPRSQRLCSKCTHMYRLLYLIVKNSWALCIWFQSSSWASRKTRLDRCLVVRKGMVISCSQWKESRNDKCHFWAKAFKSWHATSQLSFLSGDSRRQMVEAQDGSYPHPWLTAHPEKHMEGSCPAESPSGCWT